MRIFVITGAGISAESGIPTFRGKDGLWVRAGQAALDPAKLATPEAFARDPELVWQWYLERRQRIRAAEPNAAHKAIADLARQTNEFLLVTQNVDDLHLRAGLPNEKMVQIHGDIFETRCSQCEDTLSVPTADTKDEPKHDCFKQSFSIGNESKLDRLKRSSSKLTLPDCARCGSLMRPGVVWFGEMLDPWKIEIVEEFLSRGPVDLTLVIGTTALFGYILDWAIRARGENGQLVEINPEETPLSRYATNVIRQPVAVALKTPAGVANLFGRDVLNQHPNNKSD